jgi:hypothetical protein
MAAQGIFSSFLALAKKDDGRVSPQDIERVRKAFGPLIGKKPTEEDFRVAFETLWDVTLPRPEATE